LDIKEHVEDAQRRQTQMSENDAFVAFLTKNLTLVGFGTFLLDGVSVT